MLQYGWYPECLFVNPLTLYKLSTEELHDIIEEAFPTDVDPDIDYHLKLHMFTLFTAKLMRETKSWRPAELMLEKLIDNRPVVCFSRRNIYTHIYKTFFDIDKDKLPRTLDHEGPLSYQDKDLLSYWFMHYRGRIAARVLYSPAEPIHHFHDLIMARMPAPSKKGRRR